ncbi:MAG: hypothetical protein WD470_06945 [Rhodospirillaceae bacterium]
MATIRIEGLPAPDYDSVNGTLEITRRLSDKVLAAFNHAYAVGEVEIADGLRSVLAQTEAKRPSSDKRTRYDALNHADLWVGFVEARNRYRGLSDARTADPAAVEDALAAMKHAYRAWSDL